MQNIVEPEALPIDADNRTISEEFGRFCAEYGLPLINESIELETDDYILHLAKAKKYYSSAKWLLRGLKSDALYGNGDWLRPSAKPEDESGDIFSGIGDGGFVASNTRKPVKTDSNDNLSLYSTSFYAVGGSKAEVSREIMKLKREIAVLDRLPYISMGHIPYGMGALRKSRHKKHERPPAWHMDFWKIAEAKNSEATYGNIASCFGKPIYQVIDGGDRNES